MRLNVLIATCRRRDLIKRLLSSLAACTLPECLDQIHVIENGSNDGTETICRDYSDVLPIEYVNESKPGKSAAYNRALRRIESGMVVFLDDDVRVEPTLLTGYANAAEQHGPKAVYGGAVISEFEAEPPAWLVPELPRSATGWEPDDPNHFDEWFLGPNYGAFAETLLDAGGFDESIGPGTSMHLGDEMEVQRVLYEQGCAKVYVPEAKVHHHVPVNRCNAAFALNRLRLQSYAAVLEEKPAVDGQTINGAPLWLVKQRLISGFRCGLACFVPSAKSRYFLRRPWYRWTGYLRGLRELADEAEKPSA